MSQPPVIIRSDLQKMLQHIDAVLQQMQLSINSASEQLMAMAASIECNTLSLKLQQTLRRWKVYLPFKECGDVDFKRWITYLSDIHKKLNSTQTENSDYPDVPFTLDFSPFLNGFSINGNDESTDDEGCENQDSDVSLSIYEPRYAESELRTDVKEYVSRVDEQFEYIRSLSSDDEQEWHDNIDRKSIEAFRRQYTDYLRFILTNRNQITPHDYEQNIVPKVKNYIKTVVNEPSMAYCLDMALSTLIDNLRQIDELLNDDISEQQHLRLSLRLYYRYCDNACEEAERDAHRWKNKWPVRKRQERAHEKNEELKGTLRSRFGEYQIDDFIDLDHPSPFTDPEFGRFLFVNRGQFSSEDVRHLFLGCFRIQQVNNIIDPRAEEKDIAATRLNETNREIYERLRALVLQAKWINIKADDVLDCFAELLLPQPGAKQTEEQVSITENFWKLLTRRRGCEDTDFRSLKLTWLNLVGYFLNRGVLKGKSFSLCYDFFPEGTPEAKENANDYKHVNRGADHRAPNDFCDLRPVLDKMLGLKAK